MSWFEGLLVPKVPVRDTACIDCVDWEPSVRPKVRQVVDQFFGGRCPAQFVNATNSTDQPVRLHIQNDQRTQFWSKQVPNH